MSQVEKMTSEPVKMECESNKTADDQGKQVENLTKKDVTQELEHPFKNSNDTSDLRLMVEGKPLYVSRVVLSLVSPVIKRMLDMKDSADTVELVLVGRKYKHMVQFLSCIYPDILALITETNVGVVLPLAYEFQVRRLIERCEEFMVQDIQKINPEPEKIVHYINLSDKYSLDNLRKTTFESAAKTPSDLLENVQEFWELPSVTTTSIFIRRLKLLEQGGKVIRSKLKEIQNHCSLYHKSERNGDTVCNKCYSNIGKHVESGLKYF